MGDFQDMENEQKRVRKLGGYEVRCADAEKCIPNGMYRNCSFKDICSTYASFENENRVRSDGISERAKNIKIEWDHC